VQTVFLQLIDGKLTTPEEARAFLEPYSPPAPPPQVVIKRPRIKRGAEVKLKGDAFDEEAEIHVEDEEDLEDVSVADDDVIDLGLAVPKIEVDIDHTVEAETALDEDEEEAEDLAEKQASKPGKVRGVTRIPAISKPEKAEKPKTATSIKAQSQQESKPAQTKVAPEQSKKPLPQTKLMPAVSMAKAKPPVKAKVQAKAAARRPAKAKAPKSSTVKKKPVKASKSAFKKTAQKPVKKKR